MQTPAQIKVWDPVVRFFHWSLVIAFIITYVTEDDWLTVHSWSGYFILGLLAVRFIWGFIGSRHARFTDFIYSWQTIRGFLKDTLRGRGKRYLGHNPAGGAMVFLLMICLLITASLGVLLLGAEEHAGPLAHWFVAADTAWADILEELHEFFANFSLLLIVIHITGVIVESLLHRENLVSAMISGYKTAPTSDHAKEARTSNED